jgi:L-alanine-DL-glutamate epimerase-like enolase superfamily enzyme
MRRTTTTHLDFFEATSPRSRPIADATHQIRAINFIIARLTLADGTNGEGYLLAFHFNPAAIRGALADVRALAVGLEVSDTRVFNAACDQAFEYFGNTGLLRWARGVVNLAMWDAWGRHLGQPVWRLLGTHARSVSVYGSGGWLSYSTHELLSEVTEYVKRGLAGVKVKVGSPERERDLER